MQTDSPIDRLLATQLGKQITQYAAFHHMEAPVKGLDPLTAGVTLAREIIDHSHPSEVPFFMTNLHTPAITGPARGISRSDRVLANVTFALKQELEKPTQASGHNLGV